MDAIKLEFVSKNPFESEEEVIVEDTEIVEDDSQITEVVDDKEIEQVDASYNGAQISSAIDIIAKVQEGVLTEAQAIVFLIQFLQLPEQVARGFFSDNTEESFKKLLAKSLY